MGLAGIPLVFSVFTLGIRCRGTVTLRPRPSLYVGRFMLFYELHSSFFSSTECADTNMLCKNVLRGIVLSIL